jgi:hypothetical protein
VAWGKGAEWVQASDSKPQLSCLHAHIEWLASIASNVLYPSNLEIYQQLHPHMAARPSHLHSCLEALLIHPLLQLVLVVGHLVRTVRKHLHTSNATSALAACLLLLLLLLLVVVVCVVAIFDSELFGAPSHLCHLCFIALRLLMQLMLKVLVAAVQVVDDLQQQLPTSGQAEWKVAGLCH